MCICNYILNANFILNSTIFTLLCSRYVIFQPGFICLGMAPVVDGPGGFLPQEPHELRASGDVLSGPIMSGICREDGSIFATLCEYKHCRL